MAPKYPLQALMVNIFQNNTIYNFPNWFLQWWDFFGPIPEIFPEIVQQGFSQFEKNTILRNHEFQQILNIFPVLVFHGFFHGNMITVKLKKPTNIHHYKSKHL